MSLSLATDSHDTPAEGPQGLQAILSQIADIDRQIGTASQTLDSLKDRREHLEKLAVEEMQTQRLDGVRVAGRSWRVEYDHFCSVSEARKQAVMEAAKAAGLAESLTTVNTARLKAVLKEMAKAAGKDASGLFSEGTVFEGLVGEHVAPRLRHVTVG